MQRVRKSQTPLAGIGLLDLVLPPAILSLVAAADLVLPHPVGFSELGYLPYFLVVLLLAIYRGFWAATVGLVYTSLLVAHGLPLIDELLDLPAISGANRELSLLEGGILFLSILLIYLAAAEMHRRERKLAEREIEALEARETELRQSRENETLMDAITQLRDRFAVDSSSITTLYHQIPHIYAQQLPDVYRGVLQSVQVMTKATRVGIYQFEEQELALVCRDFITDRETTAPPPRLELSTSIEGWVVRRERLFSIKKLMGDPELRSLDDGRVILCGAIRAGRQLWGVVTVEEMPFTAYNEYTEKAFELILALAGPAIENAVPPLFEELADEESGGVLRGYEAFQEFLQRELESASSAGVDVALMLIEIANLEELADEQRQGAVAEQLVEQLSETVSEITGGVSALFRFKKASQLAVLLPSRHTADFSYVSRHVVEAVSSRAWNADGEAVFPEIMIGFAQASESDYAVQRLIGHAERLLSRQLKQYGRVRDGGV